MNSFVLQLLALAPLFTAIGRFEKSAGFFMTMPRHIKCVGVARVNENVIYEQPRNVEVVEQLPGSGPICRGVNLTIQCAEVKTRRILGIDHQGANVATRRSGRTPVL